MSIESLVDARESLRRPCGWLVRVTARGGAGWHRRKPSAGRPKPLVMACAPAMVPSARGIRDGPGRDGPPGSAACLNGSGRFSRSAFHAPGPGPVRLYRKDWEGRRIRAIIRALIRALRSRNEITCAFRTLHRPVTCDDALDHVFVTSLRPLRGAAAGRDLTTQLCRLVGGAFTPSVVTALFRKLAVMVYGRPGKAIATGITCRALPCRVKDFTPIGTPSASRRTSRRMPPRWCR